MSLTPIIVMLDPPFLGAVTASEETQLLAQPIRTAQMTVTHEGFMATVEVEAIGRSERECVERLKGTFRLAVENLLWPRRR